MTNELRPIPPWESHPGRFRRPSTEIFLAKLGSSVANTAIIVGHVVGELVAALAAHIEAEQTRARAVKREKWLADCAEVSRDPSSFRASVHILSAGTAGGVDRIRQYDSYFVTLITSTTDHHPMLDSVARYDGPAFRLYLTGLGENGPVWLRWAFRNGFAGGVLRWWLKRQARHPGWESANGPWLLRVALRRGGA